MRGKNIFADLPVEELSDTDKQNSSLVRPRTKRSPRKKPRERRRSACDRSPESVYIEKLGALSIRDNMAKKNQEEKPLPDKKKLVSIYRKNVTGADNWKIFLESTKIGHRSADSEDADRLNPDAEIDNSFRRKSNNCVAIDCEMVGIGEDGKENMLARVSIVNSLGECLYDSFVKPTTAVTDYRTAVSGVRPCDLVHAERFSIVQKKVLELIRDKILVGHAVYNDLIVLKIRHPRHDIRDTTRFKKFYSIGAGTPSLKKLTAHFLKVDIQCGEHNSVQDAQAAMQLYMLFRKEWEADLKKRRHLALHYHNHHTKKKPKTTYKPKRFGKNYKK